MNSHLIFIILSKIKNILMISDELCYWCNIRVNRLNYVDKLKPLSTNNSKDEFMKGDNPMNSQYSSVRSVY